MGHSARFELKYVIEEARAVAVADFVHLPISDPLNITVPGRFAAIR